ncbi:unnamed protein product [Caenorhabditis auriculariae]|uniref:Uncharacterized protein n=1 Tax=Caenorhabditis auriculariae TaxID=2777116 RepID=A0A8S1H6S4_9PELO|nr:unnamed protein product [Caenorhabditis auriculariae]
MNGIEKLKPVVGVEECMWRTGQKEAIEATANSARRATAAINAAVPSSRHVPLHLPYFVFRYFVIAIDGQCDNESQGFSSLSVLRVINELHMGCQHSKRRDEAVRRKRGAVGGASDEDEEEEEEEEALGLGEN